MIALVKGKWAYVEAPKANLELKYKDPYSGRHLDDGNQSDVEGEDSTFIPPSDYGSESKAEIESLVAQANIQWLEGCQSIPKDERSRASLAGVVQINELMEMRGDSPKIVINGILCQGWIALLAGASKSYKSWLTLDLAIAVSNGRPWLNLDTQTTRVLYVDCELSSSSLKNRLEKLYTTSTTNAEGRTEITKDVSPWYGPDFLIAREGFLGEFTCTTIIQKIKEDQKRRQAATDTEKAPAVREAANVLGPKKGKVAKDDIDIRGIYGLIILDPLYMFLGNRDENSATDMVKVFNEIRALQKATGAAILINAHFRKGIADSRSAATDRISGSGVFVRYPDVIMTMNKVGEGRKALSEPTKFQFDLDFTLRHLRGIDPMRIRYNPEKWRFERWRKSEKQDVPQDPAITGPKRGKKSECSQTILKYLRENQSRLDGEFMPKVVKRIKDSTSISTATIYRYFKKEATLVEKMEDGTRRIKLSYILR